MRSPLLLLALLVFTAPNVAFAQDMLSKTQSYLLVDGSSSLNGNKQETLAVSVRGQAVNGVRFLTANTLVGVISRSQFVQKETLHIAGDPMPKDVKRQFQAALIEVKSGPDKGKKGWTVISYQDPGAQPVVYFDTAPANWAEQGGSTSGTASAAGVDLSVGVVSGSNSPTGGRLYDISIVNKGTAELKSGFDVVVELDGKPFKTERVRGPLKAGQGTSFSVTVGDKDLRKNAKLKATADPRNLLKDIDQANNSAFTTVSP